MARQLREEIERIKGGSVAAVVEEGSPPALPVVEPPLGFDARIQEAFLPQIHAIARQIARNQVARELPEVAEKMILAELARL